MGVIQVFVNDLAEIKYWNIAKKGFYKFSTLFVNKVPLTSWICTKPNYTSAQRHTLGMWSLPLLNDESVYDPKSRFVCPSVEDTNYENTIYNSYIRMSL